MPDIMQNQSWPETETCCFSGLNRSQWAIPVPRTFSEQCQRTESLFALTYQVPDVWKAWQGLKRSEGRKTSSWVPEKWNCEYMIQLYSQRLANSCCLIFIFWPGQNPARCNGITSSQNSWILVFPFLCSTCSSEKSKKRIKWRGTNIFDCGYGASSADRPRQLGQSHLAWKNTWSYLHADNLSMLRSTQCAWFED